MSELLSVQDLVKHYSVPLGGLFGGKTVLKAVDGVSFSVDKGRSFALAGESGSGKSTLGKMMLMLERPTSGTLRFDGQDIEALDRRGTDSHRARVQAVFQDASGSLDPRMRIVDIVAEPLWIRREAGDVTARALSRADIRDKAEAMVSLVGLPRRMLQNFPHELSGGQKQRVAIARAMVVEPALVMLDEPVSALDVSVRAQILNLLSDMQERLGLTYFMISHDLATLGHVSDRMAVMYLGRMVEIGDTDVIYDEPLHPYTRALFDAMPVADTRRTKKAPSLRGEIGSALALPTGCRFHPRCPHAQAVCREVEPALLPTDDARRVACHMVFADQWPSL